MYQSQIRAAVALIAIFGHLLVVLLGLYMLVLAGPFAVSDGIQILLIASPIIAVLAVAGLKHILQNETNRRRGKKVNRSFSVIVITVPIVILSTILSVFVSAYFMVGDLGLDGVKTVLGGLEVLFGVYIGAISDTLFGKTD